MADSVEIVLPDIGEYKDVPIVEINVAVGDEVAIDTPLLSIESDKATIEVPSPAAGKVQRLLIDVGSRVSQGSILMVLENAQLLGGARSHEPQPAPERARDTAMPAVHEDAQASSALAAVQALPAAEAEPRDYQKPNNGAHASPSVRALARELGVSLDLVQASGPKNRILRDDVAGYVKQIVGSRSARQTVPGVRMPDWPKVDFEKFGAIERAPLSRIQKMTGANLSRNWAMIPHVTNFDKTDVTDIEAFRKTVNGELRKDEPKLTMVTVLIKAAALALKKYPRFNASLDQDELILKKYVHVGFAVDTPTGLVVPVIRDCDKKGLLEIASEMRSLADKAIAAQLTAGDMQGGCFSVSSLGGIGGHGFTPIINAPEVAILGAGRAVTEAVWNGQEFRPRQVVPISLSWDHRVVDGVAATQFLGFIAAGLSDLRRHAL